MFQDGNHTWPQQIGQLFSSDYGNTWQGHSIFSNSPSRKAFSFIGTQCCDNITVLAGIFNGSTWLVHHWQSWDAGLTWEGPYQTGGPSQNQWDPPLLGGLSRADFYLFRHYSGIAGFLPNRFHCTKI